MRGLIFFYLGDPRPYWFANLRELAFEIVADADGLLKHDPLHPYEDDDRFSLRDVSDDDRFCDIWVSELLYFNDELIGSFDAPLTPEIAKDLIRAEPGHDICTIGD